MSCYAPIASIQTMLKLKDNDLLGNYLLLLAHDVFDNQHLYTKLLKDFDGTVILDNSLIELGHPVSTNIMLKATEIVNPTYVVLPDALLEKYTTISLSIKGFKEWQDVGIFNKAIPCIVAQGKSAEECTQCVQEVLKEIPWDEDLQPLVSIPRALVVVEETRLRAVNHLANAGYTRLHLLGMSKNFKDDVICAQHKCVRGIDSATPLRRGFEGLPMLTAEKDMDPAEDVMLPREEFFGECVGLNDMMAYNIGLVRGAIRNPEGDIYV